MFRRVTLIIIICKYEKDNTNTHILACLVRTSYTHTLERMDTPLTLTVRVEGQVNQRRFF